MAALSALLPELKTCSFSFVCTSCNVIKSHRISFPKQAKHVSTPFSLIHSDVWGPSPVSSLIGYLYYSVFIDDATRYCWVYLMHTKNETYLKFKQFLAMVTTQFKATIQTFRSDVGGEYTSHEFKNLLQTHDIQHQFSCPNTPQQNGVSERKHRHLLETTRTLLHAANLPFRFWAEALQTSNYLINRLPTSALNSQIPLILLHGRPPQYDHLKSFGCLCFPWLQSQSPHKLAPRSTPCIFLGYSPHHKGYRCYNTQTHKLHISCHVRFYEHLQPYNEPLTTSSLPHSNTYIHPMLLTPSSLHPTSNSITPSSTNTISAPSEPLPTTQPISTSPPDIQTLPTTTTIPTHSMATRSKTGHSRPKKVYGLLAVADSVSPPTSYNAASKNPSWQAAMLEEIEALLKQRTWSLTPPPPGVPVLGYCWTYKIKTNPNGTIDRYKARLVAQGFTQQYGVNYKDTFSPVAKMPTIRLLLIIAIHYQWPLLQFDVANAFLHGDLNEEMYMKQPQGFVDRNHPNHVCRLHKALYGLKQAPRQWFRKLTEFLLHFGFQFCRADPSLLVYNKATTQLYLLIYVDDLLLTGNDRSTINSLLQQLQANFDLKQLGQASLFLGIQISYTAIGAFLHQSHYARHILIASGLQDSKPASTPISPSGTRNAPLLTPYDNPTQFRQLASSLHYLTITRPDLSFAVNIICQSLQNPTIHDYTRLKRLLRYVKGTQHLGLPITRGSLELTTYCDADWASDATDRKSITGFCTFLGNNILSWSVKKQTTVAKSSTEAEYRALASALSDVIWLRRLLLDFQIPLDKPTTIFCDNASALSLAHNPVFHARTKHIEIDHHFLSDHIQKQTITTIHLNSEDQIADILTKPLSTTRFITLRNKLTISALDR
ncbi:Retrovirus-related Pol polyprotein from transposon TNT 1-94 [Dendrobium catenatum]|uniref:Retrovirus-related Pol polyprotein from transposon TNT 1-94 n=1 Tax=Dendrobium catenatum TaxID=906689 RepID=A0A2I0X5Y8_9ASPA|nr:Retrovirus-related Pol polyprotein from transposon TNT 1-94 [Dendrobium catenatum]